MERSESQFTKREKYLCVITGIIIGIIISYFITRGYPVDATVIMTYIIFALAAIFSAFVALSWSKIDEGGHYNG